MTLLDQAFRDKKFDVRIIERSLSNQTLKFSDLSHYLQDLSDDSFNLVAVNLDTLQHAKDLDDTSQD